MSVPSSCSNIGDPFCHHKHSLVMNAEQVSEAPNFCSKPKRLVVWRDVITSGCRIRSDCELPLLFLKPHAMGWWYLLWRLQHAIQRIWRKLHLVEFSVLSCWMSSSFCSGIINEIQTFAVNAKRGTWNSFKHRISWRVRGNAIRLLYVKYFCKVTSTTIWWLLKGVIYKRKGERVHCSRNGLGLIYRPAKA
jgi:hypothetical protein